MKSVFVSLVALLALISAQSPLASTTDLRLQRILQTYEIQPCQKPVRRPLADLGKQLFESTLLAGDKDISCSTCHLEKHAFADGLAMAVGVGGKGEGKERLYEGSGTLVQRNAFTLFERGQPKYSTFFWDGKVDSDSNAVYSPFGEHLSPIFEDALAVAAILPLTERDEFLGQISPVDSNDLQQAVGDQLYQARYEALSKAIRQRIGQSDLAKSFLNAGIDAEQLELAHIGNAISAFIRDEFSCPDTQWNRFIEGDMSALSEDQKQGAVVFFGKGRCVGCHQPPFFSDFQYHSIGIPQGDFGPNPRSRDIGRANVTNQGEDLNLFRTPPLIAVSKTAPYGHNGMFDSLEEIIVQHVNPLEWYLANRDHVPGDRLRMAKYLDQRSSYLRYIEMDEDDLQSVIRFMETL